jgi:hypothetical protein
MARGFRSLTGPELAALRRVGEWKVPAGTKLYPGDYAARGQTFPDKPTAASPTRVTRQPLPDDSPWPPYRGYRTTAADRHMAYLILPYG